MNMWSNLHVDIYMLKSLNLVPGTGVRPGFYSFQVGMSRERALFAIFKSMKNPNLDIFYLHVKYDQDGQTKSTLVIISLKK